MRSVGIAAFNIPNETHRSGCSTVQAPAGRSRLPGLSIPIARRILSVFPTAIHAMPALRGPILTRAALLVLVAVGCRNAPPAGLGRFDPATDLFLAHFDLKTDVDDLHAVAGVATMLGDPRFAGVRFHAVAGAYGIQEGLYVPPGDLFDKAFDGDRWSDAHADFDRAVTEVATLVRETLDGGGDVWVADGGQSDFSAAVLRSVVATASDPDIARRFHVVQHADWNESVTSPDDLEYLRAKASYHRVPDGNAVGNGSPGFRSEAPVDWRSHIQDARLADVWETAIAIADTYNGVDDRYLNEAVAAGGLDFSDVSETCWIFGFDDLEDADAFFGEFGDS